MAAAERRIEELGAILRSRQSASPGATFRLICTSRVTSEAWQRHWLAQQMSPDIRPCTILEVAAELAQPWISTQQLQLIDPLEQEAIVSRLWHELEVSLSAKSRAFLGAGPGYARLLQATIHELRMAGVESGALDADAFPVKERGKFLQSMLELYEFALQQNKQADAASVLMMARDRLIDQGMPEGMHVCIPEEEIFVGLSQSVLDQVAGEQLICWKKSEPSREGVSDARRLAWLRRPQSAPPASKDRTIVLQRALSPEYEVRAVLKTVLDEQIPLDQVEVHYSDEAIYPSLFFSVIASVQPSAVMCIPLRMGAGVPVSWTRPGRAIRFWLDWVESQLERSCLKELLSQQVLTLPDSLSTDALFRVLQRVPDCNGPAGWQHYLNKQLKSQKLSQGERDDFSQLLEFVNVQIRLMPVSPDEVTQAWLALQTLLECHIHVQNDWDRQAQASGMTLIRSLTGAKYRSVSAVWERMRHWAVSDHLPRQSPQPGCLQLTPISGQETARRPYTFCVGLSDESYPAHPERTSLLTDRERKVISPELALFSQREQLQRQHLKFIDHLEHIPGKVQLSYTCADQSDDREQFPSQLFMQVFRLVSELPEGDLHELEAWLGAPLSPASPKCRLTETEAWLNHLPARPYHDALFRKEYPLLCRGVYSAKQRSSFQFTEHDGAVPAAGISFDPQRSRTVFSAHSLQQYARCPLQFFYQHVLRVPSEDSLDIEPGRWLHPLIRGVILHSVFHRFHVLLQHQKRPPDKLNDAPLLRQLLQDTIIEYEDALPIVSAHTRQSEVNELHETLHIFLGEETEWSRHYAPRYFETSIGTKADEIVNILDTRQAVSIALPSGRSMPVQGRVDRIDEVTTEQGSASDPPTYYVWDYKTGRMKDYQGEFVRRTGQLLQPLLYLEIVEKRLREVVNARAVVAGAGYFFPGNRGGQGDRLMWPADILRQDIKVLDTLLDLLQAGVFLPTDQAETCKTCDFRLACDVTTVSKQAQDKQKQSSNTTLRPLYQLRRLP